MEMFVRGYNDTRRNYWEERKSKSKQTVEISLSLHVVVPGFFRVHMSVPYFLLNVSYICVKPSV